MEQILTDVTEFTSATVDNPAEYQLKIRTFANNAVDFIVHRIKHRIPKHFNDNVNGEITVYPKTLDIEAEHAKRLENIERAARRARQMIQFAIRQIGADHMLTLHTRENITDREDFFKVFNRFINLVRTKRLVNGFLDDRTKVIPNGTSSKRVIDKRHFPFCAVPEKQERGAYHMHIAVVGKQDLPFLRACWYVALGGTETDTDSAVRGNIDVTSSEKRFGGLTQALKTQKLVNYLCKYLTKTFDDDDTLGIHRYTKSRGIPKPKTQKQYLMACFSNGKGDFLDAMLETIGIAKLFGVGHDYTLYNREEDLFILRGSYV